MLLISNKAGLLTAVMTKLPFLKNIQNWSRFCYNIEYLEKVRLDEGRIGKRPWAFYWHHSFDLGAWATLNRPDTGQIFTSNVVIWNNVL